MAEALFNVVVQGRLLDGFEHDQVLLQIQQQLRLPPAKARQLLAAKPMLVKQAVPRETAQAYLDRLNGLGIATIIQPVDQTPRADAAPRYFKTGIRLRRSVRFEYALWKATAQSAALVLAHFTMALGAGLGLLCYLWFFAGLLTAPPILFSAPLYLLSASVLVFIGALLSRAWLSPKPVADTAPTSDTPTLRNFVDQLCDAIALPAPHEIHLDAGAGISITPQPGLKHFKTANYSLTIGLPALLCLSTQQLAASMAGVLATGARPAAVRRQLLVAGLGNRLQHSASNTDPLGEYLERLLAGSDGKPLLATLCVPVRIALKLSTRLHAHSAATLARIETNMQEAKNREVDRYMAAVAGSEAFALTLNSWRRLERAHASALNQNFDDWDSDALVDDLPALVRHYYSNPDASDPETGSAEPDNTRLERCGLGQQPGIVEFEHGTADSLVENPQTLALAVTQVFYQRSHIRNTRPRQPAEHVMVIAGERAQRQQRALNYFNGWFHPHRFWALPEQMLIQRMPLRDAAEQLNVCVNEIRRLTPDRQTQLADYTRLFQQIQELQLGQRVLAAGRPFQFRLARYDLSALPAELELRQQQLQHIMDNLAAQEAIMGGRIALGLRLCGQEFGDLHQTLVNLQPLGARLHKLELDTALLEQLLHRLQTLRERRHAQAIAHLENKIDEALAQCQLRLEKIPHPFNSRHRSLNSALQVTLKPDQSGASTAIRARVLLRAMRAINERLAQHAADYGATAEEAYKIERIKLITPE